MKENFFYLHSGYTTFNTIVFGIVLGVIIILIIELFNKINKDPAELLFPLIPFIFLGSSSRALVDNHIYPRIYLLATPGIYIFIGLLTIAILLISIMIEKYSNYKYYNILFIFGCVLSIPNIILIIIHHVAVTVLLLEVGLWFIISLPFIIFKNKYNLLSNNLNLEVLLAHIFDATSTYVAMEFYGYTEQHVLPTFFINLTGTSFIMYPLKIIVILSILYIIDQEIKDKTTNNMLKLAIFILGLAPGLRNFITLLLAII